MITDLHLESLSRQHNADHDIEKLYLNVLHTGSNPKHWVTTKRFSKLLADQITLSAKHFLRQSLNRISFMRLGKPLLLEHHPELPPFVADSYIGAVKRPSVLTTIWDTEISFNVNDFMARIGRSLNTPVMYTDWIDPPEWPRNQYRIGGLRFETTCYSCPEQYDVYLGDTQVGYVRMRYEDLTVEYGKCALLSPCIDSYYFAKAYGNIPVNKRMRVLRQIARTLRRVHVKKFPIKRV